MAPKRLAPKGPKLIHGYTPLIGPEAWLSAMGKRWISSASTSVFYSLPHPQIRLLPLSLVLDWYDWIFTVCAVWLGAIAKVSLQEVWNSDLGRVGTWL